MPDICLYFQVHQPRRLRRMTFFEVGEHPEYFDDEVNAAICRKVARKCYIPANATIEKLLTTYPDFHVSFSLSGTVIEQFKQYSPEVIASFQRLVNTGRVELLGETYYHSLASLFDADEFKAQVRQHSRLIKKTFSVTPKVFRNTELIYSDKIGSLIKSLGFSGAITEGVDRILAGRSSHSLFRHPRCNLPLLLKEYHLSDEIAFRFMNSGTALQAKDFIKTIAKQDGDLINLFMDYETFGEHQWEQTGIFTFLADLPKAASAAGLRFITPTQALSKHTAHSRYCVPEAISWADEQRNLSAWLGNPLQDSLLEWLYRLKTAASLKPETLAIWRQLQTSDHFYYLCTKHWADGDVHKYFSPFDSPHQAYTIFNNVLTDFQALLEDNTKLQKKALRPTANSGKISK